MNLITRFATGLAVVAGLIFVPAASVMAVPGPTPTAIVCSGWTTADGCERQLGRDTTADVVTSAYVLNPNLPMARWFSASSTFHDRFDSFPANQLTEKMMRGTVQTLGMAVSNTTWFVTSGITNFAASFDILHTDFGFQVDKFAGTVGENLLNPDNPAQLILIGAILTAIIFLILFRAWRTRHAGGGSVWKKFLPIAIILALITGMSAAATGGTSGADSLEKGQRYEPSAGSPVWVAATVSDTVSLVASVPLQSMSLWDPSSTSGSESDNLYSCSAYLTELQRRANQSATSNATFANANAVTDTLNSLWTQTQLSTWKVAQFGGDNRYADYMYCRALEMTSISSTVGQTSRLTWASEHDGVSARFTHIDDQYPAPFFYASNDDFDRTMIAWAACRPTALDPASAADFSVAPGWGTQLAGAGTATWITPSDCFAWWSSDAFDGGDNGAFNIGGQLSDIRSKTTDSEVINFVSSLHGSDVGLITLGTIAIGATQWSALANAVVFGGLSLAVIFAKLYALILMSLLFVLLIFTMFSAGTATERLLPAAQKFLGATVFAFGFALLLAVIAMFTRLLIGLGTAFGGPGNPVTLIWAGFAPILAVVAIHFIFKKGLKLPSPMSPAGMFAWSAAGGAAGGAIGSSIGSRLGGAAKRAGGSAMKKATNAGLSKVSGGLLGSGAGGMGGGRRTGVDGAAVAAQGQSAESVASAKVSRTDELAQARAWQRERTGAAAPVGVGSRLRSSAIAAGRGVGSRVVAGAKLSGGVLGAKAVGVGAAVAARVPEKRVEQLNMARAQVAAASERARTAVSSASAATRQATAGAVSGAAAAAGLTGAGRLAVSNTAGWVRSHPQASASIARAGAVTGAVMLGPAGVAAAAGYGAVKLTQRVSAKRAEANALLTQFRASQSKTETKEDRATVGEVTATPSVGTIRKS